MSNNHKDKALLAYQDGLLNKYMLKRLLDAGQNGITEDLSDELVQHAQDASGFGVENDNDFVIYFFVDRFADDILNDTFGTKVSPEERHDMCKYIFDGRNDYRLDDLADYRLLTHKWLSEKFNKKAYPNISGKEGREPLSDLDKWIKTLKSIYSSIHKEEMGRAKAIDHFTRKWDGDERQKFINWMRYYEEGTTEKYAVKNAKLTKQALPSIPTSWTKEPEVDGRGDRGSMTSYRPQGPTQQELKFEEAKNYKRKMLSRLHSLKRLMLKYQDVLPSQSLENIYDEMLRLEKSLGTLNVYASMQDCVIRSANRMTKLGFPEGGEFLKEADAEGLVESLPEPIPNEPDLQPGSKPAINVNMIIDRLEGTSKVLKSRDTIRELASIDILLNEMGMASFFPEISYAQSKLIEAFSYASNKIEDIVSKLRGSGTGDLKGQPKATQAPKPAPAATEAPAEAPKTPVKPPAEPIDTGGMMEAPVGEVQKELPKKPGP